MKKITQVWMFIALLCSSSLLMAQNEGSDFPNTGTGPAFNLTTGANGFSGSVSTPNDRQDRFQIVLANGQSITSISANVTGDTSNGFIQVGNGAVNFPGGNITPLPSSPGTYQVLVSTDFSIGTNWSITVNVTGTPPPPPPCNLTAAITSQTNVACNGATTGSLTVTASSGTANYDYSWSNGSTTTNTTSTTNTITNLAAGTYTVTITDDNGCTDTVSATITEPTALVASASVNSNVSCNGGSDGSATASASGGTSGYSYSWAPSGGTNATATGLSAGAYTVTITDANGCTDTANVTITEPTAVNATITASTNASCPGASNGSATVTTNGGIAPYNYSWSPSGGNNATATGLSAGTYTVTVTDDNGCTDTANVTITDTDLISPVANCVAPFTIQLDVNGQASIIAADINNGSTDNCGIASVAIDQSTFSCEDIGDNTITLTVTDSSGNTDTCTTTVTVEDTIDPTISCTADITVANDPGNCGAVVTYAQPTASDNCSTPPQAIDMSRPSSSFTGNARGYFFVAPENFTITGLRVPADQSNGGQNIQVMRFAAPPAAWSGTSSYDELLYYTSLNPEPGFIPVSINITAGDIIGILGTRGTAPDVNAYASATNITINGNPVAITRFGTQNPISTAQAPQGSFWREASGSISKVEFEYQSNPLTVTQIAGLASGSEFPLGTTTNTFEVTDGSGNTATCSFDVTVNDTEAPTANCVAPFTVQLDANGEASISVAEINDGSTDNCSVDTTTIDITNFDCSNIGENTVTLTVTDNAGNSSTCTTTVTVEDNVAPVANCVAPFTVQLDANGQASITAADINDSSTDNCSVDTTSIDITDFDCSNIGDNTVTLTVTDTSGNSSTCTTTVTVEDNVAPVANCVAPFTVQLDANGEASITVNDIDNGSTDACGIATSSIDVTDFNCSNVGDNTVTLTVTDVNGNTSTCTTTVTVEDAIAPTIICAMDTLVSTDPGDCYATVTFPDALATDNCSGVTVTQTDGLPSGSQFPVGVSTIEFTATDASGNTSVCTFDITVEDNEAPLAACENITIQLDEFGSASITAADLDGGSTDACGVDTIVIDQDTFDCSNVGDNNVTLTVTDVNGNTSTCTAIVTVEDITAPDVVCQDITVQLDATGLVSITGMDVDGGSTDACGIASYDLDMDTFDCSNVGVNAVELTVTDNNGNTATCTAMVTVEDNTSPDLVCADFTLELGEDGTATLLPGDVIASNDDACGIDTTAVDITEFDCSDIGTPVTVQVFVSDVNGNLSTCFAEVTVVDVMAPVVTCPADQTVDPGEGNLFYEIPDYFATGEASATDNCADTVTITSQDPAPGELIGDGVYTVTLTAEDDNGNIGTCTFELTVESELGVQGADTLGTVQLYPNPANNQVTIGNPLQNNLKEAVIYDLTGRVIQTINLNGMGAQKTIDVTNLASATYLVRISSENGTITKQLIKE